MLTITDLTVRVAGRALIEGASVSVPTGARVGLVGRNGAGKTTLFKVIVGEWSAESGRIDLPSRARFGRVAQEVPAGPETLTQVVLAADTERTALLDEAETASDPVRIAEIQTRLADIRAHAAPARAAEILSGLGFDTAAQGRPCSDFSGGWRMRVALAALLFAEPDLLLLDEPTNYLDLEGTLWLKDYLARYPHTSLIISHDRELLDASVEHILHLEDKKLTLYRGNYSTFERTRHEQRLVRERANRKQEKVRADLTAFVERFRAKASKARQAQSRLKMLEKLGPVEAIVESEVLPFPLGAPERPLSPPIVAMDGTSVGYQPGQPILKRMTLRIDDDDRIGLLGANGNGKSTLLKLISGRLKPESGRMTRAERMKIAYFAQHQLDELDEAETVVAHLRRLMPQEPEARVRAAAARAGFSGERADTRVGSLSGGEKARLLFSIATHDPPHLLILDEPTNHLDIDSRAALIEALNTYSGAVMIVSHDRHLLEATVDRLWLVKDGTVSSFDGDLDDYAALVLSRPQAERSATPDRPPPQATAKPARSALRRAVTDAEVRMEKAKGEIEKIDRILSQPGFFEAHAANATAALKARSRLAEELEAAEEAWLLASDALEQADR